jgi:septum site-determining protein MinD
MLSKMVSHYLPGLSPYIVIECTLNQALIKDKRIPKLSILAASQTKDKTILTEDGVGRVLEELKKSFEYIIW